MKLLLVAVNAKYIHSNLAVYSLLSYSKKYKEHIGLVEYTINHSEEDILKGIYKEQADVITFSCYIWNIELIMRLIRDLKKVRPGTQIWLGGPEVSFDAKKRLENQNELKGIMIGEGEQTFFELVRFYAEGIGKLDEIDGLAFLEEGEVIMTPARKPLSLDAIPFPYENMHAFQNKILYYESSRGCPFSCSYCLSSIDRSVRFRSMELVKQELKKFLDYQVPQVKFVDRTFNCSKKHAMDIWKFIKEHDNGITNFHFEITADLLDEEEIQFLRSLRPGQIQLEIGVQSTNPDTMEIIQRKVDFDKLSRNVTRIKEGNNIHQHLDLIAGLPLEDYASFERSFGQVYQLKPDQLQLGFLKVLKGSLMEEQSKAFGITCRDTAPYEVLFTKDLTFDELLKLKGVCEMVEVYYNSGQFTNSIRFLEHFYESPMMLYQTLYDFYTKKQLDQLAHSRIRRYEILLDFYKEKVIEKAAYDNREELKAVFEEILLLDLYLREDMKSRPVFATPRLPDRGLRDIYEKYRKEHKLVHIEEFEYHVFASSRSGRAVKEKLLLLFDYSNRNPLNKAARVARLEEGEEREILE